MSLRVDELAPGDRVILNCPSSALMRKREAQFEGVYATLAEAIDDAEHLAHFMKASTRAFLEGQRIARFLFRRGAEGGIAFDIMGVFAVDNDGGLRDQTGKRLFIERKMRMGQG